jgi:hypothetical protein
MTDFSEPLGFVASDCHPLTTISWDDGREVSNIFRH